MPEFILDEIIDVINSLVINVIEDSPQVKSSGVRQRKITKCSLLAALGGKGYVTYMQTWKSTK